MKTPPFFQRDLHTDTSPSQPEADYSDFNATELYCPGCRRAVPVRKRLLLVLPEGEKYEYVCSHCAQTVGTKIDRSRPPLTIIR